MRSKLIIASISFFIALTSIAQEGCLERFDAAERLFDQGDFTNSYTDLVALTNDKSCDLNKIERENILVLIVRNLIELDRVEELDPWYKKIFANNKYFEPQAEIIEEDFMLHLQGHEARPTWDVSAGFGVNYTFINRLQSYAIYEHFDYLNSSYESEIQPCVDLSVGYMPWKNHRFTIGGSFNQMGYKRTYEGFVSGYSTEFAEDARSISGKIDYAYQFNVTDRFIISPSIGFRINHFLKFEDRILITVPTYDDNFYYEGDYPVISGSSTILKNEIERTETRIKNDQMIAGGIDFSYRFNSLYLFINTSYQYGLKNIVDPNQRYSDNQLVYQYYYVDEDFKMNFFTALFGFRYNFKYKIK